MLVSRDVPLAPLTTLRLGGVAARVATAQEESDVVDAVRDAERSGDALLVLGGGSNVVVADEGFAGLVLRMGIEGVSVARVGERVVLDVGAGEDWAGLVARAVEGGWSGLEALAGIPGLVGATPIQNVGAYGHEVSETLVRVRAYDRVEGRFVELARDQCGFGYRTSVFRGTSRYVVVRVSFSLPASEGSAPVRYAELAKALGVAEGQRAPAREVRRAVLELRRGKGMVLDPADPDSVSAGSFFVNPTLTGAELAALDRRVAETGSATPAPRFEAGPDRYKVPAAWLVERAGFRRGYGDGRVGVSRKHTLALVNRGQGTTRELLALAHEIRAGVARAFGVVLSAEPVLVGCALD